MILKRPFKILLRRGKIFVYLQKGFKKMKQNTTTQTEIFPSTHVHDIRSLFEADCVEISFNLAHKLLISLKAKISLVRLDFGSLTIFTTKSHRPLEFLRICPSSHRVQKTIQAGLFPVNTKKTTSAKELCKLMHNLNRTIKIRSCE